jgi:ribosome-associated protein
MLEITPTIKIHENELHFDYVRASGPGGQNVNKVATAVQLRFDVGSSTLPEEVKARLIRLAGRRTTGEGFILIEAKQFRTQERNREDALQRFVDLVRKATVKPKARRKTKPTMASKEKRITIKKRRGEIKRNRQGIGRE